MKRYLETRTTVSSSTAGADLARHLLARQHLGKTVVVCDKPVITISVVRKYWLKLSRNLQKERASTLNAEKILQLTHDITHMQHMDFIAKPYPESQRSDVFFVTPDELSQLPANCLSLYLQAVPRSAQQLQDIISQLPDRALVIDYTHQNNMAPALLQPKSELEQLLLVEWQKVEHFFHSRGLSINALADAMQRSTHIDEAIDVILNTTSQFLRVTDDFLQLLHLAQPLHTSHQQQQMYDLVSLLNRRIYAITPGPLSQQFAQTLGDDELGLHERWIENPHLALAV